VADHLVPPGLTDKSAGRSSQGVKRSPRPSENVSRFPLVATNCPGGTVPSRGLGQLLYGVPWPHGRLQPAGGHQGLDTFNISCGASISHKLRENPKLSSKPLTLLLNAFYY